MQSQKLGTTSYRNLNTQEIKRRLDDKPDGSFSGEQSELTYAESQLAKAYPGQAGFGWALDEIKSGIKMRRLQWEDNEFVFLVPGSSFKVNRAPLLGIYEEGTPINYQPHIDKCQSNGTITTWNPNNEELLSMDWIRA